MQYSSSVPVCVHAGEPGFRDALGTAHPADHLLLHAAVIFVFSAHQVEGLTPRGGSGGGQQNGAAPPQGEGLQKVSVCMRLSLCVRPVSTKWRGWCHVWGLVQGCRMAQLYC